MRTLAGFIAVCLLAMTLTIVQAAYQHGNRPTPPTVEVRESYGPDISHCFLPDEPRELWDCIRHEPVEEEN